MVNKAQKLMLADGCPAGCFLTQAQRAASWAALPPRPLVIYDTPIERAPSPEVQAILAEQEERRRLKAKVRIGKLLASKERVDYAGQRWDPRRSKWVSDTVQSSQAEGRQCADSVPAPKAPRLAKPAPAGRKPAKPPGSAGTKPMGIKTAIVAELLTRPGGCTTADILSATGWPSVSCPAMAKAAGLVLRKEKVPGQATRYFGART